MATVHSHTIDDNAMTPSGMRVGATGDGPH